MTETAQFETVLFHSAAVPVARCVPYSSTYKVRALSLVALPLPSLHPFPRRNPLSWRAIAPSTNGSEPRHRHRARSGISIVRLQTSTFRAISAAWPDICSNRRVIDERREEWALDSDSGGRQQQPVFNAPTIVMVSIAALVIVHATRSVLPVADDHFVILYFAFIPGRLSDVGANLPGGILAGYTSMITHAFLHADWLHLTLNGAWLLAFGALIARRCRPVAFLALFALSAAAGALTFFSVNANAMVPLVGASGAVSGMMGAAFRLIFSARHFGGFATLREHPNAIPRMPLRVALVDSSTMTGVGIWLAVNLIFGLGLVDLFQGGDIAWEAHVGGFLFGFLTFRWFDSGPGYRELRRAADETP